jgi:hypothetical protein
MHTCDFNKISVNKINNLRKSNCPEIFRRAKNIFSKTETPCNRHQKISTTAFWRIRPKLAFQKSVKTSKKKKGSAAFSVVAVACKSFLLGVDPDRVNIPHYLKAQAHLTPPVEEA